MTIPATMRAVLLTGHGDLDRLVLDPAHPTPAPGPGEVLVRVDACAVNNTDVNTRVGWYAQSDDDAGSWDGAIGFPRIQGADICGVVAAVGAGVAHERISERVLVDPWVHDPDHPGDLLRARYVGSELDGGYADFAVVPAVNAVPVDAPLSAVELASFPTAAETALDMLRRAAVAPGERVLVTGASGGVGAYAVQLACALGAEPIGVCQPQKAELVRQLGAIATIDRGVAADAALEAQGLGPVDAVLDVVGGDAWPSLLDALARGGRYAVSGAIAGPHVDLDLRTLYLRDLTLIGATVSAPEVFRELVGLIERGAIRPLIAATYPLEAVHDAQRAFVGKAFVGKIVLDVAGGEA